MQPFSNGRGSHFIKLWKAKRFTLFNCHVLEELPLIVKLRADGQVRSSLSYFDPTIKRHFDSLYQRFEDLDARVKLVVGFDQRPRGH